MREQSAIISLAAPDDAYRVVDVERIMTPALAIYPQLVERNISATLRLLGGDPNRWRPHVKTSKLALTMKRLIERGVRTFKCATTLELLAACEVGAADVLLAYPVVGANGRRVRELAQQFPVARLSVLVENVDQIKTWKESRLGIFVDINPGMDRTGIEQKRTEDIVLIARSIKETGLVFRGLHYYDGHLAKFDLPERQQAAHKGYDKLMKIVAAVDEAGIHVSEVITAGTPAFPCTLSYPAFQSAPFIHCASPGTIIYADCTSLGQLPREYGYRPAALVLSTVVSHPTAQRITCDAGHKTVSADAGVPTCAVLGRPDLTPLKPSEEHLPIEAPPGSTLPSIGEVLFLVPRHICPTVNNFDHAVIIQDGRIVGVERVTARGREAPLIGLTGGASNTVRLMNADLGVSNPTVDR